LGKSGGKWVNLADCLATTWIYCTSTVRLGTSCLPSLRLKFLFCKMKMIIMPNVE
jgi:hypothetical protein